MESPNSCALFIIKKKYVCQTELLRQVLNHNLILRKVYVINFKQKR